MPYIPPEAIERARQMDLLTYLQTFEPNELVHIGGNHYCTREHDSLKISNGKWYWFSRGFGGYNALDYLIKVKELPFTEAVERITGQATYLPRQAPPKLIKPKMLLLPRASPDTSRVYAYLCSRGIDAELIDFCIRTGRLYESFPHHNAVFVGLNRYSKPRYANLRGVGTDFVGEASGSDKRYSFSISAPGSGIVHLFESAIDLLSYATLVKQNGGSWNREHLVSLAGVYKPNVELQESSMPLALKRYLSENPEIHSIVLRLDNDATGGRAAKALVSMLSGRYEVASFIPIFAVLPFSGTYIDDLKTKFARFYLVRSGYFIYYESRLCICFLVGGVVVSLGGIVAFYSSVLLYLPKEEIVAYETIIMQPPFQIIILLFMTGGTWAVMGMTLSAIMESKYIAYVSPFVIYYLLVILSERYLTNIVFLYPPNWIIPDIWPYGACGAAIFLLELTLILGIVFIFLTGKRLRRL